MGERVLSEPIETHTEIRDDKTYKVVVLSPANADGWESTPPRKWRRRPHKPKAKRNR